MRVTLADKTVVVTGGTRGIGKAIVETCARAGATVVMTYTASETAANDLVASLRNEGGRVAAYKVDVRDETAMSEFVGLVEAEFKGIDVLVNNAGIIRDNLIIAMEANEWDDVISTNLTGLYHAIKPAARLMMRKRAGAIINVSSVAASRPGRGQSNYAAAKGGVEALTKALAVELAPKGIRVNCVAPGVIETQMSEAVRDAAGEQILASVLLKRFGTPQDIANAVVFLASELGAYITGEVLHVDGGLKL